MEYSKRVQELQQIYTLTPEAVFYCMLVAAGATRPEAVAVVYRPTDARPSTLAKKATKLAKENPGINKLIEALTNTAGLLDPTTQAQAPTKKRRKEDKGGQYREKSEILDALAAELPNLRGKDRVDTLIKIADLQQMKKEETTAEEERVVYYLPLRCKLCELYQKERKNQARKSSTGEK